MNEQNYATLEASKRLVDEGIVFADTDAWWFCRNGEWTIEYFPGKNEVSEKRYPAPSMAEVWRELPEPIPDSGYVRFVKQDGLTTIEIPFVSVSFTNVNPTDALIDLLIWVRKEQP